MDFEKRDELFLIQYYVGSSPSSEQGRPHRDGVDF